MARKKVIVMDRDDNQIDIWEIFRKKIWKDVYIPEDLRKKYKIKYNAKKNVVTFKKRKKKK